MLSRLGPWEIVLILVVVLFIFGVGKLPQAGKSIGRAIYEFKKSLQDEPSEKQKTTDNKTKEKT
ncbi:MAG: twin-arginine translocase TatA/TatE family subunit [Dehalococcoidales bacterium]|nr:twin-arginine translocase TatA/TatE family subunit [Dehalococcoidales bacterium]